MKKSFVLFLAVTFILVSTIYQGHAQVIYTYAGTGGQGLGGDGGPATAAQFWGLSGVAADGAGNLYLSEAGSHRIRKINASGIVSTFAGATTGTFGSSGDGGPASAAKFDMPSGIAMDAAGNVYIADLLNSRIRKIDAGGNISTIAGTGAQNFGGDGGPATAAALQNPVGVALDGAGNLYISDSYNHRIRKVNTSGIISTVAGTGVGGYSGDGGPATGAQLKYPGYIACDASGNLYICEVSNSRVRKVDAAGNISTLAGTGTDGFSGDGGPSALAQLNKPQGLACDGAGNIYISDGSNQRVRMINTAGVISTFAGTGTGGYSGDGGPATAAQLAGPCGIALDATGNVFIIDRATNRLRKICLSNCVTAIHSLQAGESSSHLYPNPSNGTFNLCLGVESGELSLYNASGQKVHVQELNAGINTIKTNGLPNGLYNCLLLEDNKTKNAGKLVIE